jgi:cytochrome c oxidase assembly factor CtaG
MLPETVVGFLSLGIGFATAGAIATGYQLVAHRPLSFKLTMNNERHAALLAVPLLVLAAPFLIMRNTMRDRTDRRASLVAVATVIAGFWSLLSGTAVAAGWAELVRILP